MFIRAPIIERTGPDVDVLARLDDGRIVAVRERNIIATAFHPELAGETRFHRCWPRWPPSTTTRARVPGVDRIRPGGRPDERASRRGGRAARSGAARLTDLAALGELSRLCQSGSRDTRSLGLPVNGPPIGVFSLFRLPLGAFRPNDLMYVYEEEGHMAGLVRVERDSVRDEWTDRRSSTRWAWPMPATSATGSSSSCCARVPSGRRRASMSPAPTPMGTSNC